MERREVDEWAPVRKYGDGTSEKKETTSRHQRADHARGENQMRAPIPIAKDAYGPSTSAHVPRHPMASPRTHARTYAATKGIPVIPPSRGPTLPSAAVLNGRAATHAPVVVKSMLNVNTRTARDDLAAPLLHADSTTQTESRMPRAASCSRIPATSRLLQVPIKTPQAEPPRLEQHFYTAAPHAPLP
jgi:hypothetical protein